MSAPAVELSPVELSSVELSPVELSPAGAAMAVAGGVGLACDLVGILVALAWIRPPVTVLGFLLINVVVSGTVTLMMARRGLRRVTSVPHGAVVLPFRFPTTRLLGSVLTTSALLLLAMIGVVTPAVLGAGIGAEVGLLWSAKRISQFERDDGRRVLHPTRRRLGQPALYAHGAF